MRVKRADWIYNALGFKPYEEHSYQDRVDHAERSKRRNQIMKSLNKYRKREKEILPVESPAREGAEKIVKAKVSRSKTVKRKTKIKIKRIITPMPSIWKRSSIKLGEVYK